MFVSGEKISPWKHVCDTCGEEYFNACHMSHRCPECQRKWKNRIGIKRKKTPESKKRESDHKKILYYADVELSRAKLRDRYAANAERYREYARRYREENREKIRLRQQARRGDAKAVFELARLEGRLHTCNRLHITAETLPCGRYTGVCTKNCPDRINAA